MTLETPPFKSCFIAAPLYCDTSALRIALEKRGIKWDDAVSVLTPGSALLDTLQAAITKADFVCCVLPAGMETNSVVFEAGLAYGKRRPMLVFVEPNVEIPPLFKELTYALAKIQDEPALDLHLDAFIQHGRFKPAEKKSTRIKRVGTPKAVETQFALDFLNRAKQAESRLPELEWARMVGRLFSESGALVSQEERIGDTYVDLSAWIDETEASLGNPILIEIKSGNLDIASVRLAERQLRLAVSKAQAQTGLLLTWDKQGKRFKQSPQAGPLIILMSVDELVDIIKSGNLFAGLLDRRNRIIHGVGDVNG